MSKYLDDTGLTHFWSLIKQKLSEKVSTVNKIAPDAQGNIELKIIPSIKDDGILTFSDNKKR